MSGGSQHNPNGRQSQIGSGWSPLQLQVANLLARAPQAHMASDRGVTWHTPTPPPHLYHVPAPSPPDPLQVLKNAGSNSMFRHTATPPELYRHTPTPPDKHLMSRHTPSPGDIKANSGLPPVDMYQHLAASRDKMVRPEDLLAYARVGVDLSLSGGRASNGGPPAPAHCHPAPPAHGGAGPALSVRDAPTINSLIARAAPRGVARVDALLERLAPSPHSVIVHPRASADNDVPDDEDSTDSCGALPGSKRKRKPERTVRVGGPPPVPAPPTPPTPLAVPLENGDARRAPSPGSERPHARRKTRSGSAETIDDIAAMIASAESVGPPPAPPVPPVPPVSVDKLHSVLAGPDVPPASPPPAEPTPPSPQAPPINPPASVTSSSSPTTNTPLPEAAKAPPSPPPVTSSSSPATPAAAPRRRSARTSDPEAPNVPVESPSEAKPAEPEAGASVEPAAVSFVEVENQLEKMFAGLEEAPPRPEGSTAPVRKRAPARKKATSRKAEAREAREAREREARDTRVPRRRKADVGDTGSNGSGSRRGPYIQVVGPRASPVCVTVVNGGGGGEEGEEWRGRRGAARGPGGLARGLAASTLGPRYDATTSDPDWRCVFCAKPPHYQRLGDLFGPYPLDTDCDEYRALDESTRRRYPARCAWLHAACGVWAPGLVAGGARLWGLGGAVWGARGARCACGAPGAALACRARACPARAHVPCAQAARWTLDDHHFVALCPAHAPAPPAP